MSLKSLKGASWAPRGSRVVGVAEEAHEKPKSNGHAASITSEESRQATVDSLHALMLIRSYRVRGHLASNMDPLGFIRQEEISELDYRSMASLRLISTSIFLSTMCLGSKTRRCAKY